jgi:hypothetical protein
VQKNRPALFRGLHFEDHVIVLCGGVSNHRRARSLPQPCFFLPALNAPLWNAWAAQFTILRLPQSEKEILVSMS